MKYDWHRRSQDAIAQHCLTNSKRPESHIMGVYPTHIQRGLGAHLWDHDGKKYLDFICGLGTNILGYANEKVNTAIADQMRLGASHSFATHVEVEAAEKLKELFPFVDCVKFLKTGGEACSAAIRIARAATGRNLVLSDGYHGWHDGFTSLTPPALGVPPQSGIEKLGTVIGPTVAAVIVEPVITDHSKERIEYLKWLRRACSEVGALLIFDEVITGFRYKNFSVSQSYGVLPDLICLGKAIANGMPLAAVGGKYAVMNCDEYFVSSTYAGETLSLAAAIKTMTLLQRQYPIEDLWLRGQHFLDQFNALWPEKLWIEGYPTRGSFKGDPMTKALFFQEACLAGILFGPSWFFNFPLAQEYQTSMGTIREIVGRLKRGEVELKGTLPKPAYAERVRAKT